MKTTEFDEIARKEISFHITGHHPTRELDAEDHANAPEWFERVRIVNFPRGFEHLQIAVYGSGITESDAAEAAHEWLSENRPGASSLDDEMNALVSVSLKL